MNKLSTKVFLILLVSLIYVISGSFVAGWLAVIPLIIAICFPKLLKVTLFLYIVLAVANALLTLYVSANSNFLDSFLKVIGLPYGNNELALLYALRCWGLGVAGFMAFVSYHNYKMQNKVLNKEACD